MIPLLARLRDAVDEGRIRPLELALAEWCLRRGADEPVAAALALASLAVADGHTCLRLDDDRALALPGESTPLCSLAELHAALAASPLAGGPEDTRPLVLEGDALYLQRYHDYERRLATRLRALLAAPPEPVDAAPLVPGAGLFDRDWAAPGEPHWQAVAAFVARRHRFAVISGGPGTGKTYTVVRLMLGLVADALAAGAPPPLIRLAAPTGKAAARMMDSVRQGLGILSPDPATLPHLPSEAATLHRLLSFPRGSTRPRHDRDHPLEADVVIVDEASMVDLPLMTKLVEALHDRARLVLLGDRYQLASVESGSVLAELCRAAGVNAFSEAEREAAGPLLAGYPRPADRAPGVDADPGTAGAAPPGGGAGRTTARIAPTGGAGLTTTRTTPTGDSNHTTARTTPTAGAGPNTPSGAPVHPGLADRVVTLRTSYRFRPDSAIGRLAAAVNAGNADAALAAARTGAGEVALHLAAGEAFDAVLAELPGSMAEAYDALHTAESPAGALDALERVRLLTVTRVGPAGSEALNRRIAAALAARHGFDPARAWYPGRPVIITHNDYRAGLFNGDTGVALRAEDGQLRVWFHAEDGPRALLPATLPAHESAYAMTVHKSQGSEFRAVTVLLPDTASPLLTRELLYTALTRASERLRVIAPEASLRRAVATTARRASGLVGRLMRREHGAVSQA